MPKMSSITISSKSECVQICTHSVWVRAAEVVHARQLSTHGKVVVRLLVVLCHAVLMQLLLCVTDKSYYVSNSCGLTPEKTVPLVPTLTAMRLDQE